MYKYKVGDTRTSQLIFNAAAEIFEEKGFSGARMQEIAERAGINKALLHYYFRNKEELFRAVFEVLLKKAFSKTLEILNEETPFMEKVGRFLDEHTEFIIKNPRLPLFLLNEVTQNPALVMSLRETIRFGELRKKLWERHEDELTGYGIKKSNLPQLIITIVSFSVFPAAGRKMISILMPEMEKKRGFNKFMRERKDFAGKLLSTALKNRRK